MAAARSAAGAALILLAGCRGPAVPDAGESNRGAEAPSPPAPVLPAPATAAAAPDRKPHPGTLVEATSAQAAAQVVHSYFDLIRAHRYAEARRLWTGGGEGSGNSEAEFAAEHARYRDYRAEISAPGPVEGAAGSSYATVPVRVHGRLADGKRFSQKGEVTLRRVNDVPGSTDEQRRWHISGIAFE
ncbi:MAG: hypothetical protein QOH04_2959 [Sphingomonadales bacterium]|jgi:hypothetical protein|nr:hypothetical protein [Sphingomonadales bacterium]